MGYLTIFAEAVKEILIENLRNFVFRQSHEFLNGMAVRLCKPAEIYASEAPSG